MGSSLARAAKRAGFNVIFFEAALADASSRVLRAAAWRFDHRPFHLVSFGKQVVRALSQLESRPRYLITTGCAPLDSNAVRLLKNLKILTANFSTDDPWNPKKSSSWNFRALREYDFIFTPRRSNLNDFGTLGCANVSWLPFAYDDEIFWPLAFPTEPGPDVLFVGGCDDDRLPFISSLIRRGISIALAGAYWDKHPVTRSYWLGQLTPMQMLKATASAKINLCLVRRANRDDHVMRSYEIAASGGFILAERTVDHELLFGPEGEGALFFGSDIEAGEKISMALKGPDDRYRIAKRGTERVIHGANKYTDRLATILDTMR